MMSKIMASSHVRDLIIIGSGPAGLTAAIYGARAELAPLVIAGQTVGGPPGGQLMLTTAVENYPGFPEGIQGPELMQKFRQQAERFGTEFVDEDVATVDFSKQPFVLTTTEGKTFQAKAVIIATGASSKELGLESEQRLRGKGISYCATCDGFFFKGKELVVIGGGDSALEEALFLTKFAAKVTVLVRSDSLKASKIMQERAKENPKIAWRWNVTIEEFLGQEKVEGVRLKNGKTGEGEELPVGGAFVAIGHKPNTEAFRGQIELEPKAGYIVAHEGTRTNIPGVFVAGDVFDFRYRQAITAAGSGCEALLDAEKWLEDQRSASETS